MKAWNLRRKTATLWCASLLLGLVFSGCSAEFSDEKCETEQDCFPGEVCSSDGLCVPGDVDLDAIDDDSSTEDVIDDVIDDIEDDAGDSDTVVPPQIFSVTLSPSTASVAPGRTVTLTATARDKNGDTIEGEGFTWTTSDSSVATVADGVVTGVALGDAVITVVSTFNENITATSTVTVVNPSVERVEIDPSSADLLEGATLQFSATAYDSDDAELPDATFTWSVDPASAATIDENGLLTALAYDAENDTVTVTVNAEGAEASATVTILLTPVDSITITDAEGGTDFTVKEDETLELSAAAFDADGDELTGRDAVWSSDDETVATVDENGVVTGVSVGNANISVTIDGVTESVEVTVNEADVVLAPVADAGGDRTVEVNSLVTLDASGSTDPGGLALTFTWVLTVPTDSGALLSNSTGEQVNFTADAAGDYIVELIAENSAGMSNTVTVTITAEEPTTDNDPVVDAGSDVTITEGGSTILAATATDVEDDVSELIIGWSIAGPDTDLGQLSDPNSLTAEFTPSGPGVYTLTLSVEDTDNNIVTDDVVITVEAATTDNDPVVDAGSDVTITEGGSTILAATATDVEDDVSDLIIGWSIAGPDTDLGQLSDPNSLTAEFTPSGPGVYTLTLSVEDTDNNIVTDDVVITVEAVVVNTPPSVSAGTDVTITEGASTTLAGTATDVEDDLSGTALTIAWTIGSTSPDTDLGQLSDPSSLTAEFTPSTFGEYTLTLTVTDSASASSSASITVTVSEATPVNTAPTANAGDDATITVGDSVTLAGSGTDTEDDATSTALSYAWTIAGPDSNIAQLDNAAIADPVFTPTAEGEYTLTLTVTDSGSLSDSDDVVITVEAVVAGEDCLIISEQVHGGGYNKAVEFYNCGTNDVDLSKYYYCGENNDADAAINGCADFAQLEGILPAKKTHVVCSNNSSLTDTVILAACTQRFKIDFNGDDRVILFEKKGTQADEYEDGIDVIIDVFGELGNRNMAYKEKTFDRCNFTPWLGVGTFTVDDYYHTLPNKTYSGLGVAPTEDCPAP